MANNTIIPTLIRLMSSSRTVNQKFSQVAISTAATQLAWLEDYIVDRTPELGGHLIWDSIDMTEDNLMISIRARIQFSIGQHYKENGQNVIITESNIDQYNGLTQVNIPTDIFASSKTNVYDYLDSVSSGMADSYNLDIRSTTAELEELYGFDFNMLTDSQLESFLHYRWSIK